MSKINFRVVILILASILLIGCLSNSPLLGTIPTDECDNTADPLQKDSCIAGLSEKYALQDPEKSEALCGRVEDKTIRDACNYELSHLILNAYYRKSQNKPDPAGFKQLTEKLRTVCDKIRYTSLRIACYDELGRPFLFRKVAKENETQNP